MSITPYKLRFLLSIVDAVQKFLDQDVSNSKEFADKCWTGQTSQAYETAIVTYLPLAKTDDPYYKYACDHKKINIYSEPLAHTAQTASYSRQSEGLRSGLD